MLTKRETQRHSAWSTKSYIHPPGSGAICRAILNDYIFYLMNLQKKGKLNSACDRGGSLGSIHIHSTYRPSDEWRRYDDILSSQHTHTLPCSIKWFRLIFSSAIFESCSIRASAAAGPSIMLLPTVYRALGAIMSSTFTVLMENPFFPFNRFQLVVCRSIFHTNQLFPNQISIMDQLQNTKVS